MMKVEQKEVVDKLLSNGWVILPFPKSILNIKNNIWLGNEDREVVTIRETGELQEWILVEYEYYNELICS